MKTEIKIPAVGESISEVVLSSWKKEAGDYVESDEIIAEIESDKASFELTAESAGVLEILTKEGETVLIDAVIGHIDTSASPGEAKKESKPEDKSESKEAVATSSKEGIASPAAKKILAEKNISSDAVKGTGKEGRITKDDAVNAKSITSETQASSGASSSSSVSTKSASSDREQRIEKLSPLRKTLAKRLVAVKNETAMLTTFNEIDMQPIMDLRKKYKEAFKEKHEVGLGFMSFFTKAVCEALKDFPAVNAKIEGDSIVYHDYVDVSVAVSTPKGLVVPVIRNAESQTLAEIEKSVLGLALKARDGKLSIEEMTGGTFTITNGGVFGSLLSTPIINAPQSAILGMHNIVNRPIAVDGQVVIRPMMYVALSYDHRTIDGRESVGFLVKIKQYIEDPSRLLLGV